MNTECLHLYMFLAEGLLLKQKSLGSSLWWPALCSPPLCHLHGFGLEMTEGQPFPYHVFTAVLRAEGALELPTLALLLYLHFLPLKHDSPWWQSRFLPRCPHLTSSELLDRSVAVAILPFLSPIPSSDFIRKSHLPYWLKQMADHCGMQLAVCGT